MSATNTQGDNGLNELFKMLLSYLVYISVLFGIFGLMVLFASCRGTKTVYVDRVKTDSIYINKVEKDSDYVCGVSFDSAWYWHYQIDSTYVKDSVWTKEHADGSTETTRWKETIKLKLIHDSIYINKMDSTILKSYQKDIDSLRSISNESVNKVVEKSLPWWKRFCLKVAIPSVILNVLFILLVAYYAKRNLLK